MSTAKIAISIDNKLLHKIDGFIKAAVFKNRSQAIAIAVQRITQQIEHSRLARECAKLDSHLERKMAEEGITKDAEEWPDF